MMRLGRRASLVVALYLLASPATAYAECAWVMWEHVWYTGAKPYLPGYGQTWTPEWWIGKLFVSIELLVGIYFVAVVIAIYASWVRTRSET